MDSKAQSLDPQPRVHGGYSFREFISRERLSHLDTQVHQETASEECRGLADAFRTVREGGRVSADSPSAWNPVIREKQVPACL